MKNNPRRSPLVMVTLVITMLLILVRGLIVSGQSPQQNLPQIKLFVDVDRLTIFIDSSTPVSLATIELQTAASDGTVQIRQLVNHFNGALQLSGGMANPGDCYIFEQSGTSTPLPSQCNPSTTHIESVSPASNFWYDRVTRQFATLAILKNGLSIGFCPAGSNCMIPLITLTHTPPTQPPFILQGSNNTGTIRLATVDDIVNQTGMNAWRDAGFSGQGVRIGVIDRHFAGWQNFQTTFQKNVNFMNPSAVGNDNITLGVNVLEVIHGIAPDADLYACQYAEFSDFQACVDWMIQQDVDIINHSASIPVAELNGQSQWAQEVSRASAEQILWVDAAGNFRTAVLSQAFSDIDLDHYHEYFIAQGNETLGFDDIPNLSGTVMLSWGTDLYDLDLVVIDAATGDTIAESRNSHANAAISGDSEYLTFDMRQPFGIQVIGIGNQSYSGLPFLLYVEYATFPHGQEIGFTTPADSADALTVGALQDGLAAPYSPGGTLSSGIKPNIVAPAEILLTDHTQFVGTSAAASVVSGYAVLVRGANPNFSRTELFEFITGESSQDDVEELGPDSRYGNSGYLHPPTPLVVPATLIPTEIPTEGPVPTLPPAQPIAVVKVDMANIRWGPGVIYGRIGTAYAGDELLIEGQALSWYRVQQSSGEGGWIASDIVDVVPENAAIGNIPDYPAPPPTRYPEPTEEFPLPPPTDEARDVPGGVINTNTPRPPIDPSRAVTVLASITPNGVATQNVAQTATRLYAGLTETAILWTDTPTPTPITPTSTGATNTSTPTSTPTSTLTITRTPTVTRTPSLTHTLAASSGPILTISSSANLRSGPGTNYLIVGGVNVGDQFPILAQHTGTQFVWYQISHPSLGAVWVASGNATSSVPNNQLPTAVTIPAPPPVVSVTPSNTPTPPGFTPSATLPLAIGVRKTWHVDLVPPCIIGLAIDSTQSTIGYVYVDNVAITPSQYGPWSFPGEYEVNLGGQGNPDYLDHEIWAIANGVESIHIMQRCDTP